MAPPKKKAIAFKSSSNYSDDDDEEEDDARWCEVSQEMSMGNGWQVNRFGVNQYKEEFNIHDEKDHSGGEV